MGYGSLGESGYGIPRFQGQLNTVMLRKTIVGANLIANGFEKKILEAFR